jgi:CHAT domain-containing protein
MSRFYQEMLEKHRSPSAALRNAQLQMLQETEWRSPFFWAAFALQGEWRTD